MFCVLSRSVRCDLKNAIQICFCRNCLKWFILVIMFDHLIVSFFDRLISSWQMTYAHSRLSSNVCLFSICRTTFVMRWFIKLDENDSSNMTKAIHQTWRKKRHLIKIDEKTSSHQIWRKRLIKFLKRNIIFLFFDKQSSEAIFNVKNLILQTIIFLSVMRR